MSLPISLYISLPLFFFLFHSPTRYISLARALSFFSLSLTDSLSLHLSVSPSLSGNLNVLKWNILNIIHIVGKAILPPKAEMLEDISKKAAAMADLYVESRRHTVQVGD